MTRQKNISISISSLVLSLMLLMPLCATAQMHKKKVKELLPDSTAFFNGFSVSADLLGVGMMVLGDYGSYEGALRLNLKDRYFPIFELGIGKTNHEDEGTRTTYKTSAPYGRIGIDFNLMKNKHDIYRLYAGVRYAYTRFKYDIFNPGNERWFFFAYCLPLALLLFYIGRNWVDEVFLYQPDNLPYPFTNQSDSLAQVPFLVAKVGTQAKIYLMINHQRLTLRHHNSQTDSRSPQPSRRLSSPNHSHRRLL